MTTLHMRPGTGGDGFRRAYHAARHVRRRDSERGMIDAHALLLDALDRLTADASTDTQESALFQWLCELGLRVVTAAACGLYIKEPRQAGLRLAAASPQAASQFPSVSPPEFLRTAGAVTADGTPLLAVPVTAGACRRGLVAFAGRRGRRFIERDATLARRLARLAALVLRIRALRDLAAARVRPDALMWEVLDPIGPADAARTAAQARRLGHDLSNPHVVVVGKAATETAAERLHRSVQRAVPHGLTDLVRGTVVAVIPAGQMAGLAVDGLSIGVSRPCTDLGRYPSAYREAQEAVDTGTKLFGPGRVTRIEDLDSYRFIPTFMKDGLTEVLEYQMMSRLPDDLLKTLEVYLDSGGNATRAAKQLFLHRNTLRQRLDRIATLLNVDLTTSERWLSLQLTVKAARLARLGAGPAAAIAPAGLPAGALP